MNRLIATIERRPITVDDDDVISYIAKAAIDSDGDPLNRHHDPCWQPDTSLHFHGKPINAEEVPYCVVPPAIIQGVRPVVLGSKVVMTNLHTGAVVWGVVADVGPRRKLGEISCEAARRLGLDGNPNHGGTDECIIRYEIWAGEPAVVDGITYALQPYRV